MPKGMGYKSGKKVKAKGKKKKHTHMYPAGSHSLEESGGTKKQPPISLKNVRGYK